MQGDDLLLYYIALPVITTYCNFAPSLLLG